jgi:hypothetical protein
VRFRPKLHDVQTGHIFFKKLSLPECWVTGDVRLLAQGREEEECEGGVGLTVGSTIATIIKTSLNLYPFLVEKLDNQHLFYL